MGRGAGDSRFCTPRGSCTARDHLPSVHECAQIRAHRCMCVPAGVRVNDAWHHDGSCAVAVRKCTERYWTRKSSPSCRCSSFVGGVAHARRPRSEEPYPHACSSTKHGMVHVQAYLGRNHSPCQTCTEGVAVPLGKNWGTPPQQLQPAASRHTNKQAPGVPTCDWCWTTEAGGRLESRVGDWEFQVGPLGSAVEAKVHPPRLPPPPAFACPLPAAASGPLPASSVCILSMSPRG